MKTELKDKIVFDSGVDVKAEVEWIAAECKRLGEEVITQLAKRSVEAKNLSYSPYSKYRVGASVLAESGRIGDGANIEIVTFSETGHAEETAVKGLVMTGEIQVSGRRFVKAVSVCHEGNSSPCNRCRQILLEFCDNCLVIIVAPDGSIRRITSLKLIAPDSFTPSALEIN